MTCYNCKKFTTCPKIEWAKKEAKRLQKYIPSYEWEHFLIENLSQNCEDDRQ